MILKLDPHIHSNYSHDAINSPKEIIKKSKEKNLDIIGIRDHNTIEGSQIGIQESKNDEGILVIPSIEITSEY